MNQEKIGKIIKQIRKENKLTQAQFAEKYGVTYQAVSKWENGKNIPDVALLRKISKDYNINIEDFLEGKFNKNKTKKNLLIITLIVLLLILLIFIFINKENNFSFKTLSSQCSNFNITGSIAYNNKKSSIYISDVNYCGKEENISYSNIECTLYETNAKRKQIISKYEYNKEEEITLKDFLKTLNFKIDDYNKTCKKYTKNSLYIIIKAKEKNGKSKKYKIPLLLEDNC